MQTTIKFLGVGGAAQTDLGHAAVVVSCSNKLGQNTETHHLLVDCGPGTLNRYIAEMGELPRAVFITHCHMDHIADLEQVFFRCWFNKPRIRPKLFVPLSLVTLLHRRLADYPGTLAEEGIAFWEGFQLIPVSDRFLLHGMNFCVYAARHHAPNSAFSLHLPGVFFYSGDTRPVPELLNHCVNNGELIFHDACIEGNPSHTGISDLLTSYSEALRRRMFVYHYAKPSDIAVFNEHKINAVAPGDHFIVQHGLDSCSQLVKIDRHAKAALQRAYINQY